MSPPPALTCYGFPTTIWFGVDSRMKLPATLQSMQARRPLVVTDHFLAQSPMVEELTALLSHANMAAAVYGGTRGNPLKQHVVAGVEAFAAHKADAVVALGGGAALDVAKAVALMTCHEGDLFDYAVGSDTPRAIAHGLPPMVALPTTAGTGSEVGRSAVVSDDNTHAKRIVFGSPLLPHVVLADPMLVLSLPPRMTAATGMDALTHLIEAFLALGDHPMCDGIALEGLRLVHRSLVRSFAYATQQAGATPEHLQARGDMLQAAMMGAVAFQKGLGVTHSVAHALSTVADLHHGLANGIMLPYCMAFNAMRVPEKFIRLCLSVGVASPPAFVGWLRGLQQQLDIPQGLSAQGITMRHVPELVRVAMADGCHRDNPVPVTEADFAQLFVHAVGAQAMAC